VTIALVANAIRASGRSTFPAQVVSMHVPVGCEQGRLAELFSSRLTKLILASLTPLTAAQYGRPIDVAFNLRRIEVDELDQS
jgi:hypothetical protein